MNQVLCSVRLRVSPKFFKTKFQAIFLLMLAIIVQNKNVYVKISRNLASDI